jgi:hypothetical protein
MEAKGSARNRYIKRRSMRRDSPLTVFQIGAMRKMLRADVVCDCHSWPVPATHS